MSDLENIKPQSKERVIDLVEKAGFDISDWANYKGRYPSQNTKYCYEWAFTDPDRGVILNLWHPQFEKEGEKIFREGNFRTDAQLLQKSQWKTRARKMDEAVQMAWNKGLPLQIIMLDGKIRRLDEGKASEVHARSLDDEFWHVEFYNASTGDHCFVRGVKSFDFFIDQFSLLPPPEGNETPERKKGISNSFPRCPKVREWVLSRAKGSCEYCGEKGFITASGRIYLETHHIIALCDDGPDLITNVIALCPNHHREAHYGENCDELQKAFFKALTG